MRRGRTYKISACALLAALMHTVDADAQPQLLWGDTHVHTANSFDAFLNGTRDATPETAYRFARGEPVIHPSTRARVQIDRPLDFIVVADHAEFYGVARQSFRGPLQSPENASALDRFSLWGARHFIRFLADHGDAIMPKLLPKGSDARLWALSQPAGAPIDTSAVERGVWLDAIASAEHYNEPGNFSALIGWEWSSTPGGANLHRIVISDAGVDQARRIRPFSAVDSPFPEDLWRWMDATGQREGARFLAIPHNSNISKGFMFDSLSLRGEAFSPDYLQLRQRLEPVAEVTQIKGDSETHPTLSPQDPFADFAPYPWYMQQNFEPYVARKGDFLRSALLRGLVIEADQTVNPYRLGLIGSSDSHTALSSVEEGNFLGKHSNQVIPEDKSRPADAKPDASGWSMSAAGLAAVWAQDNTRTAIVDAFERREVYATTGTRIALQVFASADFGDLDIRRAGWTQQARARGVPMGATLSALGSAPELLAVALRDPRSAGLDRIQVIKGWLDTEGQTREQIYNIAWSGERSLKDDGTLPAIADSVDRETGDYNPALGAHQLAARWRDPDFDPKQRAFYYIRVLEAPTPRHLLLDALALGLEKPPEGPSVIQERAYSSPIWYRP